MVINFDREKYIHILNSEGLSAALTTLHRDTETWEFETFETEEGYKPEVFKALEDVRDFSIELWNLAQRPQTKQ